MTEPLHIKYRPQEFSEFFGAKEIVESIKKNLGTLHCYLFHGQRGCGKTTLARLIAHALEVDDFEIHEMDAASTRGIDDAKLLKSGVFRKPMKGKRKMYIIDECHKLTSDAQAVWLKTLEEPPEHAFFALCTTEVNKVLRTIRSRSAEYQIKPLSRRDVQELLDWVCKEEGIDIEAEIYKGIVDACEGIPREALVLLDKVKDLEPRLALDLVERGGMEDHNVIELCRLLLFGKKDKWPQARKMLQGIDEEPEKVRRSVLGYMNKVMLGEDHPSLAACIVEELMDNVYDSGQAGLALAVYRACLRKI